MHRGCFESVCMPHSPADVQDLFVLSLLSRLVDPFSLSPLPARVFSAAFLPSPKSTEMSANLAPAPTPSTSTRRPKFGPMVIRPPSQRRHQRIRTMANRKPIPTVRRFGGMCPRASPRSPQSRRPRFWKACKLFFFCFHWREVLSSRRKICHTAPTIRSSGACFLLAGLEAGPGAGGAAL